MEVYSMFSGAAIDMVVRAKDGRGDDSEESSGVETGI